MEFLKPKVMLYGGLMGLTGFVAPFSLFCIISYFTDFTAKPLYPIKYLVTVFIVSLAVWLYCFYGIRKYRKQNSGDSIRLCK